MLDSLLYIVTALVVGFVAQIVYYFVKFLIELRSSGWDVDELERRLAIEEAATAAAAAPTSLIIELEAEAHNGVVYCFSPSTREFICQGATIDELVSNLSHRFGHRNVKGKIVSTTQEARNLLIKAGASLIKD